MFLKKLGTKLTVMLVYVDDILLIRSIEKILDEMIIALNKKFALKFLGDIYYFLGLKICKTPSIMHLNQQKYTKDLLLKFGHNTSKLVKTLMKLGTVLSKFESTTLTNPLYYKSLIGALQ